MPLPPKPRKPAKPGVQKLSEGRKEYSPDLSNSRKRKQCKQRKKSKTDELLEKLGRVRRKTLAWLLPDRQR